MLTVFLLAGAAASAPVETPTEPVKTVAVQSNRYELCNYSDVIPIVDTPQAWAQARAASLALANARLANAKTDQDKAIAQAELDRAEKCASQVQFEAAKADNSANKLTS
jgi:predicted nicotinamide N-methyase